VTGIIGMNHVGKSSILDIILFVLFDKCSRGKKSDILSKGKKYFEIKLEFNISNRIFVVHKKGCLLKNSDTVRITTDFQEIFSSNDSSENLETSSNNGNDRKETTTILKQLLCDYDDLVFSSFLFQNDYEGFIDLNQSDKVKFFHKMLKTDEYEKQSELVKNLSSENNRIIQYEHQRLYKLEKQISEIKIDVGNYDVYLLELEDKIKILNEELTTIVAKIGSVPHISSRQQVIKEYEDLLKMHNYKENENEMANENENESNESDRSNESEMINLEEFERIMEDKNKNILYCENKKLQLLASKKEIKVEKTNQVSKILYKDSKDILGSILEQIDQMMIFVDEYQEQKNNYELLCEKLQDITKKLSKWESFQNRYDDNCKYCRANFEIDEKESLEKEIIEFQKKILDFEFSFSENEFNEYKIQLNKLIEEKKFHEDNICTYENYLETEKIISWNEKIDYIIKQVENEILVIEQTHSKEWDNYKKKVEEKKKYKLFLEKRALYKNKIKYFELQMQIVDTRKEMDIINENYRKNLSNQILLDTIKKECIQIEINLRELKEKQLVYENYMNVFGKSGIPTLLFERTIPNIENLFNKLSRRLELNFEYTFKMEETKSNAINIIILLNDIPIETCSGFEKLITSIFMRICIQKVHYIKSNFLFIDEGFSNLDVQNLQKVSKIFEILMENFQNVFIITHEIEISDLFKNVITVKRNNLSFTFT
jgi:DNA repair exonuclease SbcCD ATPase subunit